MRRSLKQQIEDLNKVIANLKVKHLEDIKKVRAKEKAKIPSIVNARVVNRLKRRKPKTLAVRKRTKEKVIKKITLKATELADKRVEWMRFKNVVYIDGLLCFPVIMEYAKFLEIPPWSMVYLIWYNIIKDSNMGNLQRDWVSEDNRFFFMNTLREKGLIEKFGGTRMAVWAVTLKGRRAFLDFREYYREKVTRGIFNERLTTRHKWEGAERISKTSK